MYELFIGFLLFPPCLFSHAVDVRGGLKAVVSIGGPGGLQEYTACTCVCVSVWRHLSPSDCSCAHCSCVPEQQNNGCKVLRMVRSTCDDGDGETCTLDWLHPSGGWEGLNRILDSCNAAGQDSVMWISIAVVSPYDPSYYRPVSQLWGTLHCRFIHNVLVICFQMYLPNISDTNTSVFSALYVHLQWVRTSSMAATGESRPRRGSNNLFQMPRIQCYVFTQPPAGINCYASYVQSWIDQLIPPNWFTRTRRQRGGRRQAACDAANSGANPLCTGFLICTHQSQLCVASSARRHTSAYRHSNSIGEDVAWCNTCLSSVIWAFPAHTAHISCFTEIKAATISDTEQEKEDCCWSRVWVGQIGRCTAPTHCDQIMRSKRLLDLLINRWRPRMEVVSKERTFPLQPSSDVGADKVFVFDVASLTITMNISGLVHTQRPGPRFEEAHPRSRHRSPSQLHPGCESQTVSDRTSFRRKK